MEEVGWSGAVHDNPVALIELTYIKVIQLLPRPARVRGFQETQGTSWPRGSSNRERSGPQPSLPPFPSLPLQSTETQERLQGCALHLGLAMGMASNTLSHHFQGHLCLGLCCNPSFSGGAAWEPGSGPFPKPSGQHEPKASHASCHPTMLISPHGCCCPPPGQIQGTGGPG